MKSSLRPLRRPSEESMREGMNSRKKKSKVLKDVTNNLMAKLAHMKPRWGRPKIGGGLENKGGKSNWESNVHSIDRLGVDYLNKPGGSPNS